MTTLKGAGVSSGIAFGRLFFWREEKEPIRRVHISDTETELIRLKTALSAAVAKLGQLYEQAIGEVGEKEAEIFQVHQMMLEDEDYRDSIRHIITSQNVNAEYAVDVTAENFAQMFAQMEDMYMQGRAADVRDISERLVGMLSGKDDAAIALSEPSILVAEDLSPSQTLQMDKSLVLGFVTVRGSRNSHTAILARTMGVPAVIGMEGLMFSKHNGASAIMDGAEGTLILDPDEKTSIEYLEKHHTLQEERLLLENMKGMETVTRAGQKVRLYANIGGISDVWTALQHDAEGIGLFRTEFIYLESKDFPTEQEQFKIYRQIAENMAGRQVIIRTLDLGADKQAPYLPMDTEENPALGLRGIRLCLTSTDIFKTQLRAILRASAFGKLAIMFPMIVSTAEVQEIKAIVVQAQEELTAASIPFDREMELGIMIETPAAALVSDELAQMVDFFSVGTNDLTQYTLALDRQNETLDRFCDTHHPAVLQLIRMAAESAHRHGKWIGICGELAADEAMTEHFLKMGIDELSVSPNAVLRLRSKIRSAK